MDRAKTNRGVALELQWAEGIKPPFEDARLIRRRVFVEEQGFSLIGEFDDRDADSCHLILYRDGDPVCTARMFEEHPGALHVGRVAVMSFLRGKGVGLLAMELLAAKARELGAEELVLNAQEDKADFYLRAGFALTGETSLDEGCPHVEMRLNLAAAGLA